MCAGQDGTAPHMTLQVLSNHLYALINFFWVFTLVAQWLVFSPDVDALQSADRKFVVILTSEL